MDAGQHASVLVTGASRGLGRALVQQLEAAGHRVIATARDPDRLVELSVDQHLRLDVTDPDSITRAIAEAGPIDIVVNNAAVTLRAPVEATTDVDAIRLWDINVLGSLRVARAVLPQMRQRGGGTILNVSSLAATVTPPLQSTYAATKAALDRLSEGLRFEVAPFGIHVVTAAIGPVATTFSVEPPTRSTAAYQPLSDQVAARQRAFADSGRPMPPSDVAVRLIDAVLVDDPPPRVTIAPLPVKLLGRLNPGLLGRLMTRGLTWSATASESDRRDG